MPTHGLAVRPKAELALVPVGSGAARTKKVVRAAQKFYDYCAASRRLAIGKTSGAPRLGPLGGCEKGLSAMRRR
ncbi:hypothetical protein GCM10022408_01490 [Hymenobacter fastidiosus]|uniref:Uncharacterized protein n=1 Tax=Hymenobacter fastidiosus TaxID=486264 RepID=A0ABP7RCF1_9BACT